MTRSEANRKKIKEVLDRYPSITSIDELGAKAGIIFDEVEDKDDIVFAIEKIKIANNRLKVDLKDQLKEGKISRTAMELLYRLLCTDDELKRLGVKTDGTMDLNIKVPVVEIKTNIDGIEDKIKSL